MSTDRELAGVLSGVYHYGARVDAWLGSRYLGRVPVAGGSVAWSTSQKVQGSLSLSVPRTGAATEGGPVADWAPTTPWSPLACYGQVLHVSATVTSPLTGRRWTQQLGRFVVTSWDLRADTVSVTGKSLLAGVEEDRLVSPVTPLVGGTLASEARRLLGAHAGLVVDPALEDRAAPASMCWQESRIDALYEIAEAWPARLREGRDGVVRLLPALAPPVVAPGRVLTDGQDGTVVGVTSSATRDKVYNRVVVRSQGGGEGAPTVQEVAEQTVGPMSVTGPYGAVTRFFSSPLVATSAGALATARSLLRTSLSRALTLPVEVPPDPTLVLDEAVAVVTAPVRGTAPTTWWGRVSAVETPLVDTGRARVDVEVVL